MSRMSSVFTKIINGDLPARFVYRDETCVAFLSIEPLRYGHTLVVPVEEVNYWTDLSPETWAHLNEVSLKIGKAIRKAFDADRAGYMVAGFEVPHTHIHLFPADTMRDFDISKATASEDTDETVMDEAATRLRQHLGTDEDGRPQ